MSFTNVKWIMLREIRDQLRDRRTLFMIVVLPIVLYPLMGLSLFQVSQFMQEQPTRVLVVGAHNSTDRPLLFEKQQFAKQLFANPARTALLDLHFASEEPSLQNLSLPNARAEADGLVRAGKYEAALYFPADFSSRLDAFRKAIRNRTDNRKTGRAEAGPPVRLEVPSPEIIYTTANDKSQIAFARLSDVLRHWTDRIGEENLAASGVPQVAVRPFLVESADVADAGHRGASAWSKIFPVLLLLWALTGAFYPAIDLCAGEKERGTLETLLSSPAQRSEIVVGKLGTVMLFSIMTAVLNLLSVGLTGWIVVEQLPGFGLPPVGAIVALLVALLPISALFSALCLALAAFARSSKEGQYYLMPLLIVTMPLVILPMSPGVDLNLGTSLIPITNVVLLLRCVLEGSYWQAIQFSPAVAAVTITACMFAIRWAVDQFNRESVLFRESERLDLGLWLVHLVRDRQPTPTAAAAACCGILILVVHFFLSFSMPMPKGFGGFAQTVLVTQLAVIALPAVLMTLLFTRSPRETLLLRRPVWAAIPAAALLAVMLHPAANVMRLAVQQLYPVGDSVRPALEKMQELFNDAGFWPLVCLLAVLPAVCEELAFRGFILSGFRRMGHPWRAIVFTSILFGVTHGILQQSLIASLLGVVLGFLAIQSGSILPCMTFHVVHNSLAVVNSRLTLDMIPDVPLLRMLIVPGEGGGCDFTWPLVLAGIAGATVLLAWFAHLTVTQSPRKAVEEPVHCGVQESLC